MKNLLVFLVLLSHMNFSMFIPQLDEADRYDAPGKQEDDINSLYEFIDQVVLGNQDDTPEDEDDDNAVYYHIIKVDNYCSNQNIVLIKRPELSLHKATFSVFLAGKIPSVFFEIQSPPPDA